MQTPHAERSQRNWQFCLVFVFFWSNISQVETVETLQERPYGYGQPSFLLLSLKMYLEQFLLCNQNVIPIQTAAALWQWSHFHLLRVGIFRKGEIWTRLCGL